MPTGYTAGILDGTINSFPEFAKVCIRAFGAAIHMREDSLDVPYEPRTPSKYHLEQLEEDQKALAKCEAMSDDELVSEFKDELMESRKYHETEMEKSAINLKKLNDILSKAQAFEPPTDEHVHFKEFMIEQLTSTIKFDFYGDYHREKLAEIDAQLNSINPNEIRAQKIGAIKESIDYHNKQYKKEVDGCNESNKWVKVLLDSI